MTFDLGPFDIVMLPGGLSEHGIPPMARAVILEVHYEPYLAYEVEVVDTKGSTLFVGVVDPAQVQLVHRAPIEGQS